MVNILKKSAPPPDRVDMKARQTPLMEQYAEDAASAIVFDHGGTSSEHVSAGNPLESAVTFCNRNPATISIGVHEKVGGDSDYATPGDVLCGAIAACLDSTIRIICNRLRVSLLHLAVDVTGTVDVRGTLRVDKSVPVGFSHFDVAVQIKTAGYIPGRMIDKLLAAAESSCVVIKSLNPDIDVRVRRVNRWSNKLKSA